LPNRLYVDELVSIGLVPSGDNPDAEVLIYKSHPDGGSTLKPDVKNAESVPTTNEVNMDLSAIEDQDLRKSVEDKIAELETQISELAAPETDEVVKAESEEVQEAFVKQQEEIAVLRKDLDDERTARRTKEYVEKAVAFQALLGKADEVGPILADIAENAPESYEKLEGALTAAAQRKDMAKLFSEVGAGEAEGETDPVAKRDVWVEKNQKDGESVEAARSRFWNSDPDAVEESRV